MADQDLASIDRFIRLSSSILQQSQPALLPKVARFKITPKKLRPVSNFKCWKENSFCPQASGHELVICMTANGLHNQGQCKLSACYSSRSKEGATAGLLVWMWEKDIWDGSFWLNIIGGGLFSIGSSLSLSLRGSWNKKRPTWLNVSG